MEKGKSYAQRKNNKKSDYYCTPKSLIWAAEDIIKSEFDISAGMLEPCAGKLSIAEELAKIFKSPGILVNDIYYDLQDNGKFPALKVDYLTRTWKEYGQVITNPPFMLFDEFVNHAKTHCRKFMFIGRLNYLSTQSRLVSGIWKNLKAIYPFSRYIDYRTPYRTDGAFNVGAMATGWFLWDMEYKGYPGIKIIDVQKYATLGGFYEKA